MWLPAPTTRGYSSSQQRIIYLRWQKKYVIVHKAHTDSISRYVHKISGARAAKPTRLRELLLEILFNLLCLPIVNADTNFVLLVASVLKH